MKKIRPYFKKADIFVILLVILASATGFFALFSGFTKATPTVAEIRVNTVLVKTIDLKKADTPYTLTVEGNFPVELEISNEGVRFINSECPDKLCIHSGLITSNRTCACLPAGVSVEVKSEDSSVDAVAG